MSFREMKLYWTVQQSVYHVSHHHRDGEDSTFKAAGDIT